MADRVIEFVPVARPTTKTSRDARLADTRAVLHELVLLLEDYAPAWYTQEHHDRAFSALLPRDSQA